jgi:hypothetical protein
MIISTASPDARPRPLDVQNSRCGQALADSTG